jgi:hypothetical protein
VLPEGGVVIGQPLSPSLCHWLSQFLISSIPMLSLLSERDEKCVLFDHDHRLSHGYYVDNDVSDYL